jgi:hypothetical protein
VVPNRRPILHSRGRARKRRAPLNFHVRRLNPWAPTLSLAHAPNARSRVNLHRANVRVRFDRIAVWGERRAVLPNKKFPDAARHVVAHRARGNPNVKEN